MSVLSPYCKIFGPNFAANVPNIHHHQPLHPESRDFIDIGMLPLPFFGESKSLIILCSFKINRRK